MMTGVNSREVGERRRGLSSARSERLHSRGVNADDMAEEFEVSVQLKSL